ncbi:MAG TPA: adenylate/guanylate cyclase domain-containing protein [Candidatus Udaeobacter sp.]|nr:adenylate/guanylate cyclase domain-containing protein [Candidatus Udaeobacter sp.]
MIAPAIPGSHWNMPAEVKKEIQLEIAHVLFIDIVGYSRLSINQQHAAVDELTQIVRATEQFQNAEASERLIKISTGDGIALVFYTNLEAPLRCAMELSRLVKDHPRLRLRMGIHSGPVSGVIDVTGRTNLAGAGLNLAQRVMNCGDAGHILLSKHVAEDLEEYEEWRPLLHELGECEVKHGLRVSMSNLYSEEIGNPAVPEKVKTARAAAAAQRKRATLRWLSLGIIVLLAAIALVAFFFVRYAPQFAATALAAPEKSIAVLPFQNLSKDEGNAFFADGVQDEILTDLARIADLKVISRTSVMQYKSGIARNLREISQQLGVANVLEGSVQRSGNRVRVNAQLVDARTDKHLWGQTYDRDLADVFAIQSEVAKTIADQLQARLSPREEKAIERPPTSDISAFDLYTRAKNILLTPIEVTKTELVQAVDLLNQAVGRDPLFFDAYCQLAYAHDNIYFFSFDHTSARLALAEAAIQVAARLRPDAGETHLARARNLYLGYRDYDGALAELEIAGQTLPNDFRIPELMAYIQRRQGNGEESIRNLQRAAELNPRDSEMQLEIAANYAWLRRYADQKSALARALAIKPSNAVTKVLLAGVEFDSKADAKPLHQTIDSIRATNAADVPSIVPYWLVCALAERDPAAGKDALDAYGEEPINLGHDVLFNRLFAEGLIARMTKDESKARSAFIAARAEQEKIVQAEPNYATALCALGLIDAAVGRKEDALREGRRAAELLPIEKDAIHGVIMVQYLAMIAAWVGDKDLACERLATLIHQPGDLSYGELKLMPFWDPLRDDPRFEKIVEESKKPVVLK